MLKSLRATFFRPALVLLCLLPALLTPRPLPAAQPKELRVGLASMITPVSTVIYYQRIVDYLSKKLGIPGRMVHRTSYAAIDRMLKGKKIDLAFICSAPYVQDQEEFGAELLVVPVVNGAPFYRSYIITHADSPAQSFMDLRNRSFVFTDPKSNSGRLYPVYWLAKQNLSPDTFFSRHLFSYSHNKSVEMVAKEQVDAAAVDSLVYDYMVATDSPYTMQTKIIHKSPLFGIPPVVVSHETPRFLKEKLQQVLLSMHDDPEGREILAAMKIDRFALADDTNYDSIRRMRAFMVQWRSAKKNGQEQKALPPPPINCVIIPRDNPRIAYERYQPLIDYLSAATGRRFELLLKKTYQETVAAIGSGEALFGILGPLTYLDAYARFDATVIAKSRTANGEPVYRSVIITGPKSHVASVADLAGKKFAFASLWSTSGNLIPRYMLAWNKIHLDKLAGYKHYNYHDTVTKKVIAGVFDAGAVRRSVAVGYLPYGVKILETSDSIPTGPVVVSPGASYNLVRKVQQALFNMDTDPQGKKILPRLDADLQGGFVPASDADYRAIRKMINDVPKTCGIGCHPPQNF